METTTIQISRPLKRKLEKLKAYPNETMDKLIERLADSNIDYEPLSKEELEGIEQGLKDIREGKVYSLSQVRKKLGI